MKKSITLILIVTIIAGLIVIFTTGFNVNIATKASEQININIGEKFENKDIKQIAKEVLGKEVEVQKAGDFEDQAVISADQITQEQVTQIINKINEKYGKEVSTDGVKVTNIPATRLSDLLMPCVASFILVTVLILIYFAIRYRKQDIKKVIGITLITLAILEILVLSIIALLRIPVGQNLVSISFITYCVGMFCITTIFENKAQKLKLEEANNKKNK